MKGLLKSCFFGIRGNLRVIGDRGCTFRRHMPYHGRSFCSGYFPISSRTGPGGSGSGLSPKGERFQVEQI